MRSDVRNRTPGCRERAGRRRQNRTAHTRVEAGAVPSKPVGGMQELPDRAFKAMVESSVSPFVVLDDEGRVSWAGPRVQALLGRPVETVIGGVAVPGAAAKEHEAVNA